MRKLLCKGEFGENECIGECVGMSFQASNVDNMIQIYFVML